VAEAGRGCRYQIGARLQSAQGFRGVYKLDVELNDLSNADVAMNCRAMGIFEFN
jgi:hypothetical protein